MRIAPVRRHAPVTAGESGHDHESPPRPPPPTHQPPPPPLGGPKHAFREPHVERERAGRQWSPVPGALRPKSVRAKIVSLLMVPVVSLMALWGFATVTTAQSVSDLSRFKEVSATLLGPASDYITAVQAERSAAAGFLAKPDAARLGVLNTRAKATESAAASLRRGIDASSTDTAALQPELPARTQQLTKAAKDLRSLRQKVTAKKTDWDAAYDAYTKAIERGFAVGGALTGVNSSGPYRDQDEAVASEARVVQELSRAREMIAREDAVVGAALARQRLTEQDYRLFTGAVSTQRTLLQPAVEDLRPADRAAYRSALGSDQFQQLAAMERALEDAGPGRIAAKVSAVSWDEAAGSVLRELRGAEKKASTTAAGRADPFAFDVVGSSGVAVILGLVGVLLSLLISMQIGRGLVVELVGMRNSALEMAGDRLPQSLRRLHSGEEVDIDAEAPVQRRGEDEIGQVGAALNAVHRAAVRAAAERAEVLSGISGVYVKLARRSQVLLHRQLGLLDTMERRVDDPAELEDLFRLDHLTTRMRRHAESLIILSGAAPVRGWHRPVPMLDVVRAAVAEVEDFTRVDVQIPESMRISGAAVADLTHLLAELVENAVVFSPPHTKVRVRGELVGTGLALEIEDRGLGMSRDALAAANDKIADASQVDLLDTERLGLFVVNRLAHRRDIQVSLQRSAYGGVTAVVLVPEELLERDGPAVRPGAADAEPERELELEPELPEQLPATRQLPVLRARRAASSASSASSVREPVRETSAAAPAGEPARLPRRVRQASLAPQLRDAPDARDTRNATAAPGPMPPVVTGRTPDRARATMVALRHGWLRGGRTEEHAERDVGETVETPSQGDDA